MKTVMKTVKITKEMVQDFEGIFGVQRLLPPIFPMIFYQYMAIPWYPTSPPILRKQKCTLTKNLLAGRIYYCQVHLEVKKERENYTLYTETLYVYDEQGEECSRCVSVLLTRSPLQKKK